LNGKMVYALSFRLPVWIMVFKFISWNEGTNLTEIRKNIHVAYAAVSCAVKDFEIRGLVVKQKSGRIVKVVLTEKGKMLSENINALIQEREKIKKFI